MSLAISQAVNGFLQLRAELRKSRIRENRPEVLRAINDALLAAENFRQVLSRLEEVEEAKNADRIPA